MSRIWGAIAALCACACTDFPTILPNVCGNAVIDQTEDCDGFGLGAGTKCRAPGTVGECHFDCSEVNGVRTPCPGGMGCDSEAICRIPTGDFVANSPSVAAGAWSLVGGDFDGDGRGDMMSLEPFDSIGGTRLRFHYFDERGALAETRVFPKLVLAPFARDLSGDKKTDVAFSQGAVGVMLGRTDRSWVPEIFSSYRVPNAHFRVIAVFDEDIQQITPMVPLVSTGGNTAFVLPNAVTGKLAQRADYDGSIANLAGEPVSGNLLEDPQASPCREPVLAQRGSSHFTVVNACTRAADGSVVFRDTFEQTNVELQPRVAIDSGPLIVDIDGDGHLDVLVGAGGTPYIAYGDGAHLAEAIPYRVALSNTDEVSPSIAMPLAVGDFSGDGFPDFVFPDHLLVSVPVPGKLPSYLPGYLNRLGAPWTSAKIADFNHDGNVDVALAAAGVANLDYFAGTGSSSLIERVIATDTSVEQLAVGDFDGDSTLDLAFVEQPAAGQSKHPLGVVFGAAFTPLSSPTVVGQLTGPEEITAFTSSKMSGLVISSVDSDDGTPNGALAFLDGDGDRLPLAPYALTSFSSSTSVSDSLAVGLATGSFTAPGQGDVMAVAFPASHVPELWLLPAIETPESRPTRVLTLDSQLTPVTFASLDFTADFSSTAADLNRDGQDEAVFAMPAGKTQDQCGVLIVSASDATHANAQTPLILDEACNDPVLASGDVDGDGAIDLVLLTGRTGAQGRNLYVFWNDGAGNFDVNERANAISDGETPQAFTLLVEPRDGVPAIAFIGKNTVRIVDAISPREFSSPRELTSLPGASGIAAGDVNADGVTDLVVAASGQLSVLQAELEVR